MRRATTADACAKTPKSLTVHLFILLPQYRQLWAWVDEAVQHKGTIVRLLLRHGTNVDAMDSKGRTPLDIVTPEGNSWIAKVLSEYKEKRG